MSRWLDIARKLEHSAYTPASSQQKPAKRSDTAATKGFAGGPQSQQKPAERARPVEIDFLLVSAGTDPNRETPAVVGENDFLLVSAGCWEEPVEKDGKARGPERTWEPDGGQNGT